MGLSMGSRLHGRLAVSLGLRTDGLRRRRIGRTSRRRGLGDAGTAGDGRGRLPDWVGGLAAVAHYWAQIGPRLRDSEMVWASLAFGEILRPRKFRSCVILQFLPQ